MSLLGKDAIEPADQYTQLSEFYSVYFFKSEKSWRVCPILDLMWLNKFVKVAFEFYILWHRGAGLG